MNRRFECTGADLSASFFNPSDLLSGANLSCTIILTCLFDGSWISKMASPFHCFGLHGKDLPSDTLDEQKEHAVISVFLFLLHACLAFGQTAFLPIAVAFGGILLMTLLPVIIAIVLVSVFLLLTKAGSRSKELIFVGRTRHVRRLPRLSNNTSKAHMLCLLILSQHAHAVPCMASTTSNELFQYLFETPISTAYENVAHVFSFTGNMRLPFVGDPLVSTMRERIGEVYGLRSRDYYWNNFAIHEIRPKPFGADPLELYYLLELPFDRGRSEAVLLLDIFDWETHELLKRTPATTISPVSAEELVDCFGIFDVCFSQGSIHCTLQVASLNWDLRSQDFREVYNGAYVKLRVKHSIHDCADLLQQDECMVQESLDSSESSSFMQVGDLALLRRIDDPVYRLITDRRDYLNFDPHRGGAISVWTADQQRTRRSRDEFRVWLDMKLVSWTQHCTETLRPSGTLSGFHFFLVQPLPHPLRMANNRINLVAIATDSAAEERVILADLWFSSEPVRTVLQIDPKLSVKSNLDRCELRFQNAEVIWQSEAEPVVLYHPDVFDLPSGSYVHISETDQCEDEDVSSLVATIIDQVPPSLQEHNDFLDGNNTVCPRGSAASERHFRPFFRAQARALTQFLEEDLLVGFLLQWSRVNNQLVHVATHGLDETHIATRFFSVDIQSIQDTAELALQIREHWWDHVRDSLPIGVIFVAFASQQRQELHFIVDLWPLGPGTPVLADLWFNQAFVPEYAAYRAPRTVGYEDLFTLFRFPFFCEDLGYRCLAFRQGVWFNRFSVVAARIGDLFSLFAECYPPASEEEDDTSLVQVAQSSRVQEAALRTFFDATRPGNNLLILRVWRILHSEPFGESRISFVLPAMREQGWRLDWNSILPEPLADLHYSTYMVTPTPPTLGVTLESDAQVLVVHEFPFAVTVLVDVVSPEHSKRFVAQLHVPRGFYSSVEAFERWVPDHSCGNDSWCRVTTPEETVDWPEGFYLENGWYVLVAEIRPEILDHDFERSTTASETTCTRDFDASPAESHSSLDSISFLQIQTRFGQPESLFDLARGFGLVPNPFSRQFLYLLLRRPCDFALCQSAIFVMPLRSRFCAKSLLTLKSYVGFRIAALTFTRLPPPGNPQELHGCPAKPFFWVSTNLQALDDVAVHPNFLVIFDYPGLSVPTRVPISISEALAIPTNDAPLNKPAPQLTLTLPDLDAVFDQIMCSWQCDWPDITPIEESLPLPTALYFNRLQVVDCLKVASIDIFTDGSFCKQDHAAGWAFVALGNMHDGSVGLIHAAFGPLLPQTQDFGGTGVTKIDSRSAETEALLRGLIWRIASQLSIPFCFKFDSTTTGFPTAGWWGFNPNSKHLRVARSIALLAEAHFPGTNNFTHVFAHRGFHGNELADSLAKLGRYAPVPSGAPSIDFAAAVQGDHMPIEWLWTICPESQPDLPVQENGLFSSVCAFSEPCLEKTLPPVLLEETDVASSSIKTSQFGFLTYNVGSLDANNSGHALTGHEYLRTQLQAHKIHFAFLQETRSKHSGVFASNTHFRYVAKCANGRGGCEIWLLRALKGQKHQFVHKDDVVTLHQGPELLILKVTYSAMQLLLVSGHSPHSGKDAETISTWWTELRNLLSTFDVKGFHLILGVDANAHFASEVQGVVGPHGLESSTNLSARLFTELMVGKDLFIPATFPWFHHGDTATWRRSARTKPARCDYLCFPQEWFTLAFHSENLLSLDFGRQDSDHVPHAVWVNLSFSPPSKRPKCPYDREAIMRALPHDFDTLQDAIDILPWDVNVHEHAMSFISSITNWLTRTFPAPKSKPRATYISASTWEIREERLSLQKRLRHFRAFRSVYHVSIAWLSWKLKKPLAEIHESTWHLLYLTYIFERRTERSLDATQRLLRTRLREDRTAFVETIADEAQRGPSHHFHKTLRRAGVTGKKKQSYCQPLPFLKLEDGTPATSTEELAERWRSFFADQEDGIAVEFKDLLSSIPQIEDTHLSWQSIPSLLEYEAALRGVKTGRAFFSDGLPGDILHKAAGSLSRAGYALFLKHCLTRTEPLLFRGGRLTPFYKGKGDTSDPAAFRSIFVSSPLAKVHHFLFRTRLSEFFDSFSMPLQLGGRKRRSVSQASHALQSIFYSSIRANESISIIFVDIKNAFYRVIRSLAVPFSDSNRTVLEIFHKLNLDDMAYQDFCAFLAEPDGISQAGVDPILREILSDSLHGTWFTVNNSRTVTQTRQGSRPGDVFADLVFGFAFRRVVASVLHQLRHLGLVQQVRWSGAKEPLPSNKDELFEYVGPIWADDLAVVVRSQTPLSLIQATQATAGVLLDRLTIASMQPNLSHGKTEILMTLRGKGSMEHRRRLTRAGYVLPTTSSYMPEPLQLTGAYRHLGTWLQVDGALTVEIKTRLGVAHATFTQFRISVFGNKKMKCDKKLQLFDSLILSALYYNSATWPPLPNRQKKCFEKGVRGLYKRLAINHFGRSAMEWSDNAIAERLGILSPDVHLRGCRLRYLAHIIVDGDQALRATLQQFPQWWKLVEDDVAWLQQQRRFAFPFGSLLDDWKGWFDFIYASPSRWKSCVRRALLHAAKQQTLEVAWHMWHVEAATFLVDFGGMAHPCEVKEVHHEHYCVRCSRMFCSKSAWSVHAFRCHQRTTPARAVASDLQCGECLRTYATHVSVINHLRHSSRCRKALWQRGLLADLEPSINSRSELKQRPVLRDPFLLGEGPILPPNMYNPYVREWNPHQHAAFENLVDLLDSHTALTSCEQGVHLIKQTFISTILHHDEIKEVLFAWFAEHVSLLEHEIWEQALEKTLSLLSAAFFLGDSEPTVAATKLSVATFGHWLATGTAPSVISRPLSYKPFIFAHLYSGHRRPGDLQDALERAFKFADYQTMTLSIDIVFHEELGNLLNPATFAVFKELSISGRLVAAYAGPPCETWSRARLRGEHDGGPTKVRSESRLFGLTPLSIRELNQVHTGNELLGGAIKLAILQLLHFGMFVLEHPIEPSELDAPSIWKTDILKFLCSLPFVQLIDVFLGHFGMDTAKPTSLMVVHPPSDARAVFRRHHVRSCLPRGGTIGRTGSHFNTSKLKQYPAAFCDALADLAVSFVAERPVSSALEPLPEDLVEQLRFLQVSLDNPASMGPDYHPV